MKINSIHKVLTLSLILLLIMACESTKSTNMKEVISRVSIEKITRGSNSTLEITKSEISNSSTDRENENANFTKETSEKKWKEINRIVSGLDLNEMENWEAPTQERFHDGAKATTIKIESDGQQYSSQSFDEGKPPAQLQELYDYLVSLVNQ